MDISNVLVIRDLINLSGGQVIGKKKIQKIIYIVQKKFDNIFDPPLEFEWDFYGVYSNELAHELSIGEYFNIFKEVSVKEYNYLNYAIETVNKTQATFITQNKKLKEVMIFLNNKELRFLEILSFIILLKERGFSKDKIGHELLKFRKHLKESFTEAYTTLENMGIF